MSLAAVRNFALAQQGRERNIAGHLDDPSAQFISDPGWQAFFAGLDGKKVDFGSFGGNDMQPAPTLYGSPASIAQSAAFNDYLTDQATKFRLSQAAVAQANAGASAAQDANQSQWNLASGVDRALQPGLTRSEAMSAAGPGAGPAVSQMFAQQDAAARADAQARSAMTLQQAQAEKANAEAEASRAINGGGVDASGNPVVSPLAKQIAEYRVPPPSPRSLQTAAGQALMAQIARVNPSFDASQFPARNKMRQAFTSGQQGQALNSLNTAIVHLDQFANLAKGLDNSNIQSANALKNWFKTEMGDSAPTNFDGMRTILSGELASAFKKSGATDDEIGQVKSAMSSKQSPQQLVDYVTKIAIPALGGKAQTYQDQWAKTMGASDPFSVYTDSAKAALGKYGAHGAQSAAAPAPAPVAGGMIRARDPQGKLHQAPAGTPLPAGWKQEG